MCEVFLIYEVGYDGICDAVERYRKVRGMCGQLHDALYPNSVRGICNDHIAICVWPTSLPLFSWDSSSKGACSSESIERVRGHV